MKTFSPLITTKIAEICRSNDVSKIGLFGSTVRGEDTPDSDLDLLVYFSKPKSLLGLLKLERELMMALNRKVDLLTEAAISPYLRDRILGEVQIIYEA